MTKLFDEAIQAVRRLPPEGQDSVARVVLALTEGDIREPEEIDPAHLSDILEGLEQIRRGEFASDEEVQAVFRRFEP